ncbi:MAG: hypothetical protein EOO02_03555 [Chitinophagaceae bacterium]|nr:MAG: hypothetical protein EOO02_03555 [Chitinophagaceae bacterium]
MSLAIGFLIIFLLTVPGIVFRVTYLSSPYSKRNINTTTLEEIYSSLIPAFIFHCISVLIITSDGRTINYQFVFNLLIGNNTAKDINDLNRYLHDFLLYMLANTLANFLFALLLRWLVLRFKLYKVFPALRIYNRWYDILKPKSTKNEKNSVWLDILLETRNDVLIYRGFLTDFWLDKDGGIKELHLEDVRRRVMSKDLKFSVNDESHTVAPHATGSEEPDVLYEPLVTDQIDERYYYIPGERFIIKYEDVKNMNITYYSEQIVD